MKQWIKLFPEYEVKLSFLSLNTKWPKHFSQKGTDLYGLGSGVGGDWVSSFGLKMNSANDVGLNFKGIAIMSELTSPINRVGITDYAYQVKNKEPNQFPL